MSASSSELPGCRWRTGRNSWHLAVTYFHVFGAVVQPHAKIAVRFAQNFSRIILAAIGNLGIFLPLDAHKRTDPGDDAAELVRHLPCGVESANAAGGKASDGVAVSVFAKIVFGGHVRKNLVTQEARITVADCILKRAAHRVFQGTFPLSPVALHEIESRRTGRSGNISRIDGHDNHHRNLLLGD